MAIYKRDLHRFRVKTPLTLFCHTQGGKIIKPPGDFKEIVVKFKWPENKTLEDVEKFRQVYASHYNLRECALMIAQVRPGSFIITWFIPESVVETLNKTLPKMALQNYSVTKLDIAGACVYRSRKPQEVSVTSCCSGV